MNFQSSVPVSGISQQSQPAMPTPGTVPVAVPVPVPQSIPSQFGSGSSASSGAGQFGSGTVSGQAAQPAGSQFVLSNSAAIRAEIHRFESVHPNIYAIYDLIERIDDLALQNQIREHVISIEGEYERDQIGAFLCLFIHWGLGGWRKEGGGFVSSVSLSFPFLSCTLGGIATVSTIALWVWGRSRSHSPATGMNYTEVWTIRCSISLKRQHAPLQLAS